ncbi:MAG: hypothetical protein HBSAPP03_06660 [Phycisphaerae bacterium]|nr:MAG: hypothetical protein HBSAPP03_06660 [Phycisphaerae bacterium]
MLTRARPVLCARAVIGATSLAAIIAACSPSPFAPHESDYARRVANERLRQVPTAPLDSYRKPAPPEGTPPTQPAAVAKARFEGLERADLTLEACRASALEHNLSLRVAVIDPSIAAQRVSEEDARFESAFTLRSGISRTDSPTSSQLNSAQNENQFIVPGVRIPTRTGGTVTVTLPVSKNENNNSFSTLNPAYASDVEFSISHPLLRGAGRRANTAQLRVAGYDQQASESRTKLEVIRQLAAVDRSYWRLFQARRELEVRQQQHDLAAEQLARAERRQRAGAVAEIEVVRAQAGAADRLEAIILAQNAVLLQQRELKRLINQPGLALESRTLITPTTPPDPVEYAFDPAALLAAAIDNRMEMLELELQLAADAVRLESARNAALPLLTLDYTYRVNGLGASMQDTFHTLQRNNFADWELGLSAEIPFGNEAAKSRIRQAILARLARLATRAAREQAIRQEVLNAVDSLDAGWQRILAARQSVILNTRALQGEQRQFEVGAATSTDVLDAAARLADAQSAEVRALTDYQIAQVDLAFATGTLLGAAKVEWEPAPMPGVSRWGQDDHAAVDAPTPAHDVPQP